MTWHHNVVLPAFLANPEHSVTPPRTRRFSLIHGTFSPASEMTSSTVLTGRAEMWVELSQYNSCGVAIILRFLCGVWGAGAGALFTYIEVEDDVAISGHERA
jgi:hypothetical protein